MVIPLDYYRILGTPLTVTDEQLTTAYQDRIRQLPRREYSELAIASRRHLLEQGYQLLIDPQRRSEYQQQFLEGNDSQISGIKIEDNQLTGALLLLQELGEYDLVASLGQDYLHTPHPQKPIQERADIILSIVLAKLELSREHWHRKDYEQAALIASQALDLLRKDDLFPLVQAEITTDVHKLRPYRILELLATDLTATTEREQGLQLLQSMLQERRGMEGKGNDRSGLNLDKFLQFIQQLRPHLTVAEQLTLFKREAQRPSWVATYLKVYALIAQGFAYKQAVYIQEAQETLVRLGQRQDVSVEMAISALLLGQTAIAIGLLEKSQETEPIEYIRSQSGNSGELLLGLCRYGERWLQTEVFCHFRDLVDQIASLKDYFANAQVQAYLEPLAAAIVPESDLLPVPSTSFPSFLPNGGVLTMRESYPSPSQSLPSSRSHYPERVTMGNTSRLKPYPTPDSGYRTQGNLVLTPDYSPTPKRYPRRRRPPLTETAVHPENLPALPAPRPKTPKKRKKFPKKARLILGLFGMGILGLSVLAVQALQAHRSPLASLSGEQLEIFLNQPPLEIADSSALALVQSAPTITPLQAQKILESWLSVKTQALGKTHQVDQLKKVLAEPMLSTWRKRAQGLGGTDYWQYQHQVQVQSLQVSPQNPNLATLEAIVKEKANYYAQGTLNPQKSFNDNLRVRYHLVRIQDQWLIKDSQVLPK